MIINSLVKINTSRQICFPIEGLAGINGIGGILPSQKWSQHSWEIKQNLQDRKKKYIYLVVAMVAVNQGMRRGRTPMERKGDAGQKNFEKIL